jgi:hypothetical protein
VSLAFPSRRRHHVISAYSNVHARVQTVTAVGILDPTDDGVSTDYDVIETTIAIDAARHFLGADSNRSRRINPPRFKL